MVTDGALTLLPTVPVDEAHPAAPRNGPGHRRGSRRCSRRPRDDPLAARLWALTMAPSRDVRPLSRPAATRVHGGTAGHAVGVDELAAKWAGATLLISRS